MTIDFTTFFSSGANGREPRPHQVRLAAGNWPETLIIPTGFGKTAAVLAAWAWKVARRDTETPRRLVYCLPMRTLVEQTEAAAKIWIKAARQLLGIDIQLDVLMGGRSESSRGIPDWIRRPDRPTVLIGTQDILVSAALMRGYGASRYRWPVDFALLHNDAQWVFDEVQLTGATLSTSAQLEAFRRTFGSGRCCRTLWMSATLDPVWLKTADFAPTDKWRPHDLDQADLDGTGHLWRARKQLRRLDIDVDVASKGDRLKAYAAGLAKMARERAKPAANTILFLNTVFRAQSVYVALTKSGFEGDLLLIHSRFRKADRDARMDQLSEKPPAAGRIIVATQALEAGVDVSSATMITEIAPWSSLVQRFGRCNRYGECGDAGAEVFWIDAPDEEVRPYTSDEFAHVRKILEPLSACGPSDLASIPPSAPSRGAVIRRRDLLDLFDTDPDLSGFDVDVSLYVRDADDTDVRMFWRAVDEGNIPSPDSTAPDPAELCSAPIGGAKQLLARNDVRAWVWDALARGWRRLRKDEVFPGMTLFVDVASGGYDPEKGFDPTAKNTVGPVPNLPRMDSDPAIDNDEDTASKVRVSLAKHSLHVREEMARLGEAIGLSENERSVMTESALWHDLGKAHETFKVRCGLASADAPLAKTPDYNWRRQDRCNRPYFRHELASALAYLAHRQWDEKANLAAYLIAAHHGKLRMHLRALPKEARPREKDRLFARGVWGGDVLPETNLGAVTVPRMALDLDIMQLGEGRCGPSWQSRTQDVLKRYGPFRLAWYEALLRIADWRASAGEEAAGHDDL